MTVAEMRESVGPCPVCGRMGWLNNIPVQAYCWGPEDNEHPGMTAAVPGGKWQPE